MIGSKKKYDKQTPYVLQALVLIQGQKFVNKYLKTHFDFYTFLVYFYLEQYEMNIQ